MMMMELKDDDQRDEVRDWLMARRPATRSWIDEWIGDGWRVWSEFRPVRRIQIARHGTDKSRVILRFHLVEISDQDLAVEFALRFG